MDISCTPVEFDLKKCNSFSKALMIFCCLSVAHLNISKEGSKRLE